MAVDDGGKRVIVHKVSKVQPSQPTTPRIHSLSNLDLAFSWALNYLQLAVYFKASISLGDVADFINSLKESLSKTLDQFPPMAGRLVRDKHSGRLQLNLNGEGIPFYEASTEARMDEEGERLFYSPLEVELNPQDYEVPDIATAPMCRVQVTVFACGGVAIGLSSLHAIMDGLCVVEFVKAWGEIHRQLPLSTPPNFSTELLRPRDPPQVNIHPLPEILTSLFEASRAALSGTPSQKELFDLKNLFANAGPGKIVLLDLPGNMVDKLIQEVEHGAHSYGHASSFEAISALLWKSITLARDPPEDELTNYTLPVSIRGKGRWEPPLPEGFFGNAALNSVATARAGDILSNDISFAAAVFHRTVKQVTPELVRSAIDWIELQLKEGLSIGRLPKLSSCTVISTSFAHFPISSVDFGFGELLHLGQTIIPIMALMGVVHVMPSRGGGGGRSRRIAVALPEREMRKLLEDEAFACYFPALVKDQSPKIEAFDL